MMVYFLVRRWDTDSPIKPDPSAYMPFGMGPRNCVGMRFAMEEMKIALCTLIAEFRFFPVDETPVIIFIASSYILIN